jgi:cobalt-precorrin 5A hydrolase
MKASILSFTRKGANLSIAINDILKEHGYETVCYTTPNYAPGNGVWHDYEPDLKTVTGELFKQNSLLVFVSACGIAVRTIAPWIKDKRTDPAVICLDEKGKQVIPLLSGHIGGANRMARVIAAGIGAQPVITTATDINGLFAVDEWARKNDL